MRLSIKSPWYKHDCPVRDTNRIIVKFLFNASTKVKLEENGRLVLNPQCPFLVEFAGLALFCKISLGLCKWISANMTLLREGKIQGLVMLVLDPVLLI